MKKRLCFVVHRYDPYQGGSEMFVKGMAEECVRRGHDVTVFSGAHKGDRNGVKVTSDASIFDGINPFDLIIVHGANVSVQDYVLKLGDQINAPILYLLILPSESNVALLGMKNAAFLGCSTTDDFNHATKHEYRDKMVSIRHAIPGKFEDVLGEPGIFKRAMGIETPYMFLSSGGFWPHKGMDELAEIFEDVGRDDVTLVLTGYQNPEYVPSAHKNVRSFICEDRKDVLNAMADADLYIMNSTEEGFGLCLLEAMANKTAWAARKIAGAVELQNYGLTYTDPKPALRNIIANYGSGDNSVIHQTILEAGFNYVKEFRQITNTVDDIEVVLKKC